MCMQLLLLFKFYNDGMLKKGGGGAEGGREGERERLNASSKTRSELER